MTSGFLRAAARLLTAVTVAVAALTALAAPSSAHAALTGTDPKPGATLDAVPATVRLTFSDPLDPQFVRVRVTTPDGAAAAAEPTVDGQTVTVTPDDAGAGRYTVAYRVVSKDGHPVSGTLTFTVRSAAPTSTPTGAQAATPTASAEASTPPASPTDAGTPTPAVSPGAPTDGTGTDGAGTEGTATEGTGQTSSVASVGIPTGTIAGVVALVLLLGAGAWFAVRRRAD